MDRKPRNGFGKNAPREPRGDYAVGYCKPPKKSEWKKGVSPNPSGKSKRPKWKTYSTSDGATQTLTQLLSVKKGDQIVKIRAIDAVFQKRLELALKGDRWAIKSCCEDARTYGLLMDPRIKSLSQVIRPEDIKNMTDAQLELVIDLLRSAAGRPEEEHETKNDCKVNEPGLYTIGDELSPGEYKMYRTRTAREALLKVANIKASSHGFRVLNKQSKDVTEAELRTLADIER